MPVDPTLELRLLGPFRMRVRGIDAPPLRSRPAQAVLANLALAAGREQDREYVAFQLWPDSQPEQALANLRQNLSSLRSSLGPEQDRIRTPDRRRIALDTTDALIDVLEFDSRARSGQRSSWLEAVENYAGPLLPGLANEWVAMEREHRQRQFETLLERLIEAEVDSDTERLAVELLRHDPVNETAVRRLLSIRSDRRDVSGLNRLYEEFRRSLRRLYGTEPSGATESLFRELSESCRRSATTNRKAWIPAFLGSFVGRDREKQELAHMIDRTRCVIVVGAAGIGKTRLLAATLAEKGIDGIWIDSDDPAQSMARRLNVHPDQAVDALRGRAERGAMLIAIDGATSSAREFVCRSASIPHLRFVLTARETLDIAGAESFRLGPLETEDAIKLLGDDSAASRQLVEHVGGRPTALEMLAPMIESTSAEVVLDAVRNSGLDSLSPLRVAFEASWDSLERRPRQLLGAVACFSGGFDAPLVRLLGSDPTDLQTLVDKSWITFDRRFGTVPFRLSPVVREFVRSKLPSDCAKIPTVVANRLEALRPILNGPQGNSAVETLRGMRETSEQAFDIALATGDAAAIYTITSMMWPHLLSSGEVERSLRWVEACSKMPAPNQLARIRLLNGHGFILRSVGGIETAIAMHREAIDLSIEISDRASEAESRERLALALYQDRRYSSALAESRMALSIFQDIGDRWWQACLRHEVATIQIELEDYDSAAKNLHAAEYLARRIGDRNRLAWTLETRSQLELRLNQVDDARTTLAEAADLFSSLGYRRNMLTILLGLAAIEERAGNFGEAEARYREMIGITEEIDFERLALNGYLRLGALYLRLERETDAEDAYCAARRIAGLANQWERAAIACDGLAKCARHEGRSDDERRFIEEAARLRDQRTGSDVRG